MLFGSMEANRRAALGRAARTVEIPRGRDLAPQEDSLIVLASGVVAMTVGEGDRRAVMAITNAPAVLNLDAVTAWEGGAVRWRALAPSRVLLIPGGAFRAALLADPDLATRACQELAGAYKRLLDWATAQRLLSAQQRVAAYLLSLSPSSTGETLVELPYEKHLLASLLGMTPENLSRALGRLAAHGVRVKGAKVSLRVEALRDLVASNPASARPSK